MSVARTISTMSDLGHIAILGLVQAGLRLAGAQHGCSKPYFCKADSPAPGGFGVVRTRPGLQALGLRAL